MPTADSLAATNSVNGQSLLALDLPDTTRSWTEDDCLLYAVGVGAGSVDSTLELNLTTENSEGVTLQTIPAFGIILCNGGPGLFASLGVQGKDVLLMEEQITLARPIPTSGSATAASRIVEVVDHPRGFVVTIENDVRSEDGTALFVTRAKTLIRAARTEAEVSVMRRPARARNPTVADPSVVVDFSIAQNQCLLYRLASGRNPLHSDPAVSRRVGYEVPLLHGRCTLGFAARHLIAEVCHGDASKLTSMGGALSAPVFPGDDLTMRIWTDGAAGTYDIIRATDGIGVVQKGTYTCQS